ncbi:SusC/RagA family TonB-linked outer membrane protein [Hufsiella ginkgonis]|uniref:SusC/RagA family TonB-linked outer membrane protein n=1 Tax=Hufsiella ginkgonis TaxID=2695274 RepID=A0A7K1XSQ2_9SPHI|nr:SusC/RagA family TonB-linked outer membrane protein [Hufsiella ginkgonis]MXV13779.1 SusC/RagA family TonB-linked outer membrane protein [Hufsiella ginkgonis]
MRKKLLFRSKKTIYSCLLASGVLLAGNSRAAFFQDSTRASSPAKDTATIKPTVPVLYSQQPRDRVVGAIGYLDGKTLESAPVSLLANAFTGRLAGLYSSQTNGAPRFDNPVLSLRGRNPLVVIDGIPRYNLTNGDQALLDVLNVNPEQIESVSLLKDGLSSVMLGNRAMDGVLMITTRAKGTAQGSTISVTGQAGLQSAIGMRKSLSSYDFASLYNEALANSGLAPVYTPAQLSGYQNGTDPYMFPNVDWQHAAMRDNAPLQRYTVNAGGNYSNVKYFLSLDYQNQQGLFKESPAFAYGTNINYNRYVFRSNIEFNVDKNMSLFANLLGNMQDYVQPGVGYAPIMNNILVTPNNATPVTNVQGSLAGSRVYPTNPYADATSSGYLKNNLQAASVDVGLKQKADGIIRGSWIKGLLSYSPSYEHAIDRSRGYDAFNYPVASDTTRYLRVSTKSEQPNTDAVVARFQQAYFELSTGVDRTWNNNGLSALVLASYDNGQSNSDLNQVYKTLAARVNYSYDRRFVFELAGAYSGNNRFGPDNRFDFYPAAGFSWLLHNESFLKDSRLFSELKLRASYGRVGNANPGYYSYRQTYAGGGTYYFGGSATSVGGIAPGAVANPNRTVEKADKLNLGLDLGFARQRGWLNIDYYNNKQFDLLQVRGDNSAVFGNTYPVENLGKNRYSGIELNTGWSDHAGPLTYNISANLSTVSSKILFNDEAQQAYSWMQRTGSPVNQIRGYVAEGFFSSGNLGAAAIEGYTPVAGDVKYMDLNSDGVINASDQKVIGNDKALMFYGASAGIRFKGIDVSILFQGVKNRDILTTGDYQFAFGSNGKMNAYERALNRWTPATAATATLPRVTIASNPNNFLTSSLYVRNGDYVRLRNAEIGFTVNGKYLPSSVIKGLRIFVNGQNLATFSKYKDADPENYTSLYPIQRIINGGLSVKL